MAFLRHGLVLFIFAALAVAAWGQPPSPQQAPSLGHLSKKKNEVKGALPPDQRARDMNPPDAPVFEKMRVTTGVSSAGLFTVGERKARQGAITLGPESILVFFHALVDVATGTVQKLGIETDHAQARFFFTPRSRKKEKVLGAAPHEVVIRTPSAKEIKLRGTDLYLEVTPERTILFVYEGAVEVQPFSGERLVVQEGQWTQILGREPPQLPSPFDRSTGPLSPGAKGPAFDVPGEWLIPGPALLDLSRLDLPQ